MRSGHVLIDPEEARRRDLGPFRGFLVAASVIVPGELFLFACLAIGQGWWTP